jgi:hypothetical protein
VTKALWREGRDRHAPVCGSIGLVRASFSPYNMRHFSRYTNALAVRIGGYLTRRLSYAPKTDFERATNFCQVVEMAGFAGAAVRKDGRLNDHDLVRGSDRVSGLGFVG